MPVLAQTCKIVNSGRESTRSCSRRGTTLKQVWYAYRHHHNQPLAHSQFYRLYNACQPAKAVRPFRCRLDW